MPNIDKNAIAFIHDPANKEKYLNELWKELHFGVAFVSIDGSWLEINSYLCELLEYTESELKQRNFKELTHPDDVYDDIEMSQKLRNGDISSYQMSKRFLTKTGKIIWVKSKVTGMSDNDGNFIHFISQVEPAIVLKSPEEDLKKDELKDYIDKHKKEDTILGWLKKEWKWILTTSIIVLGFLIDERADFKNLENITNQAAQTASKNAKEIQELKDLIKKTP